MGLERSSGWGTRVRVVVEVRGDRVKVADHNGVYGAKTTDLNMSLPGFLESPLSKAMEREYSLDKAI